MNGHEAGTQKYTAEGTHGVLLGIWADKVQRGRLVVRVLSDFECGAFRNLEHPKGPDKCVRRRSSWSTLLSGRTMKFYSLNAIDSSQRRPVNVCERLRNVCSQTQMDQ